MPPFILAKCGQPSEFFHWMNLQRLRVLASLPCSVLLAVVGPALMACAVTASKRGAERWLSSRKSRIIYPPAAAPLGPIGDDEEEARKQPLLLASGGRPTGSTGRPPRPPRW